NAIHNLNHVGATGVSHFGDTVRKRDFERQKGVGGNLNQLGAVAADDHIFGYGQRVGRLQTGHLGDAGFGAVDGPVQVQHGLGGGLAGGAGYHAVEPQRVNNGGGFARKLRARHVVDGFAGIVEDFLQLGAGANRHGAFLDKYGAVLHQSESGV